MRTTILIALGSNENSSGCLPSETLRHALVALTNQHVTVSAQSAFYQTEAFPAGSGPDFVNAAAALDTRLTPFEVLEHLHRIESEFGRLRTRRWGQRVLDLDLIAVGDQVLPDPQTHAHWRDLPLTEQLSRAPDELILPHPRLQDRAFVLVPLAEIAPDWRHPVLGQTVSELRDALDPQQLAGVRRLG